MHNTAYETTCIINERRSTPRRLGLLRQTIKASKKLAASSLLRLLLLRSHEPSGRFIIPLFPHETNKDENKHKVRLSSPRA
jgi:hypothetical protein